jgi:methylenetetrahydrofolate dehydrogenase (NADP+) / methenyltetrahydrofolate cyclohydrolase
MPAKIIDGTALAAAMREKISQRVAALGAAGRQVKLTAILIGATPAAEMYARRQGDGCAAVGIGYDLLTLPAEATAQQVNAEVDRLNADTSITGVMLHQPVPEHLDSTALQARILANKDVEGVNPANLGYLLSGQPINIPCTALAAIECIASTGAAVRGADVCVVGASEIVGKPVALLLSDQRGTVSICRSATKNLADYTRKAQIIVAAVGKAHFITADHITEGAVVIDVGINRITLADGTRKTVGDVEFDSVKEKAGYITPVPGGVGPLTVAMLLRNTVDSAERALV